MQKLTGVKNSGHNPMSFSKQTFSLKAETIGTAGAGDISEIVGAGDVSDNSAGISET